MNRLRWLAFRAVWTYIKYSPSPRVAHGLRSEIKFLFHGLRRSVRLGILPLNREVGRILTNEKTSNKRNGYTDGGHAF